MTRFCLVASLVLCAGAHAQTLDIVPSPKAGEVQRLELRSFRERALPNRPKTSAAATTPVELEVLSASDKGFVVAWRQGRTSISGDGRAEFETAGARALLELAQQTVFELEFDASADFTGLRNYEQVRQQMGKILDALFELVAKKANDDELARRAMEPVRAMFADRKRAEAILLRDVLTYFFPLGKSFSVDKPHAYDTVLPNPLGGEPLGARGSITVDSIDRAKMLAQVTLRQAVSPDAMRIMLESMLKAMPDAPRPSQQELAELRGEISDEALFVLDLRSGWPLRTEYTRTVSVPGGGQVQKVTITRTP